MNIFVAFVTNMRYEQQRLIADIVLIQFRCSFCTYVMTSCMNTERPPAVDGHLLQSKQHVSNVCKICCIVHGKECVCTQKPTSDAAENGESGVFKYSQAILRYSQKWEQAQSLDFEILQVNRKLYSFMLLQQYNSAIKTDCLC